MILKKALIFCLTALLFIVIADMITEGFRYFLLLVAIILPPIILSFIFGTVLLGILKTIIYPLWLQLTLLVVCHELAFAAFEKQLILFGLFRPETPVDTVEIDISHFVYISTAGLIGAAVTYFANRKSS